LIRDAMAELKLFNSFTRAEEPVRAQQPPQIRMYACGPTVYHYAHIGNFRSFLLQDILRRALKFFGHPLRHVLNVTDVDDKTIRGAREAGMPLRAFTDKYLDAFLADLKTLNVEMPEHLPRATEHVPQIIRLIETLIAKDAAYVSPDGSVYFRIKSFACYGCLSRIDISGLMSGARVAQDEYQKETVADFALWKAWAPEDGDVVWDSPWGRGRPGWHIECSAMSMHYLGESFDIHCGGVDLMFPHHENEIAQSEAATGKKFVNLWVHSAHLLVDNQKMSKSLGNLYTVADVLGRGFSGRELRYALISSHYRQQYNFTWEGMAAAKAALGRIDAWVKRAEENGTPGQEDKAGRIFLEKFREALAEDLNVSGALGHLFDFIRDTNKALDAGEPAGDLAAVWRQVDVVLGLGESAVEIPAEVQALLEERAAARRAKDFAKSDSVRAELDRKGWAVKDTPKGQEVRRK
jgi:cysteinyl-tRNA synthetase